MIKFALKNMLVKKFQVILIVISIILSCGVAVLAYNTSRQISDGITSDAKYYSVIIGPSGSSTQLVMNTVYYTDDVVGTIPYELVSTLQQDNRVKKVIPFAMADSYKGYNLIGTTKTLLEDYELDGTVFSVPNEESEYFEAVIGYTVAKTCNLKIGDVFYTSHSVGEEHHTPFKVTGILKETHSSKDTVIYTHLKSIWLVHEEGEEEHEEEHDHEELNNMVCAIIINTYNPTQATSIVNEYNNYVFSGHDSHSYSLQAVEPMGIVRSILNDVNTTKYIVYALCLIILIMNIMIITVITLLNMYHSTEEIELMRLIGISMPKINLMYLIQNSIIGFVSIALSFGLSRLALSFMGDYIRSTGAMLNMSAVYPLEILIMVLVFLIAILPTLISTYIMSKRSGIRG